MTMTSRWSDADARAMVEHYAARGVGEDLALRVYTSRLLGGDPRLVQHGGGNTSVKTTVNDSLGRPVRVLCVKGSGWDLGDIEPAGLPACRLEPLLELRRLNVLSDEGMVAAQRTALMDPSAPNPSVEALLHAWVAPRFVDHSHANAILALADQPDGEARCRDLFGARLSIAPYVMPGFALAQLAAATYDAQPDAEGMVLLKHGLFTWGEDARTAYERHIAFAAMADAALAGGTRTTIAVRLPATIAPVAAVAPIVRGALQRLGKAVVLDHRATAQVLDFVGSADLHRLAHAGPATPDHVIRIKPWPLVLPAPGADDPAGFAAAVEAAAADYADRYRAYFARNNAGAEPRKTILDVQPRVVLVPGVGLFGAAASHKDAAIAADIYETNIAVIGAAEAAGRYESIGEADIFDMEYWSLEQAKLGKAKEKPLARRIVAVTGGGSGIGAAAARAFAAEGAEVAVLDKDLAAAQAVAKQVKGLALACDVTDADSVRAAFDALVQAYGGLDILVSNAGYAPSGRIGQVDEQVLRDSFEVNFWGHQRVAQAAIAVFQRQGTGGVLLFNASKQALNPGPDFGPYGLPKAALLALMRQYAIDHGAEGVRANAVNADRIRTGLMTDEMIARRSAARGLSEAEYMGGNLLRQEVTADDVAQAFVSLALATKTTAAVITVDGGNIAAAVR
jgi:rhamnose utilization protein RhaD (predicted bifunctional aldolase and dehydrogenase)/NAD(P)-dependent dehydrogenase (short-subunit alcohol dehydrogenase family)